MFTYLTIKDRQQWMDKDDYEDIALAMLMCLGTILLDILIIFLQPIFIIIYILIFKKKNEE